MYLILTTKAERMAQLSITNEKAESLVLYTKIPSTYLVIEPDYGFVPTLKVYVRFRESFQLPITLVKGINPLFKALAGYGNHVPYHQLEDIITLTRDLQQLFEVLPRHIKHHIKMKKQHLPTTVVTANFKKGDWVVRKHKNPKKNDLYGIVTDVQADFLQVEWRYDKDDTGVILKTRKIKKMYTPDKLIHTDEPLAGIWNKSIPVPDVGLLIIATIVLCSVFFKSTSPYGTVVTKEELMEMQQVEPDITTYTVDIDQVDSMTVAFDGQILGKFSMRSDAIQLPITIIEHHKELFHPVPPIRLDLSKQ